MIKVTSESRHSYHINLDKPEERLVSKVADSFGIVRSAAMTAIWYRGCDSIIRQLEGAKPGKTLKQNEDQNG